MNKNQPDSDLKLEYDKYFALCLTRIKQLKDRGIKIDKSKIISVKDKIENPTYEDLKKIKIIFIYLYN